MRREDTLDEQIESLPNAVLECRDTRHWYRPKPFYKVEVEGGRRGAIYLEREVACTRCKKAHRLELFVFHKGRLERLEARPKYDKGYLLHGVPQGTSTKELCRLEQLRRAGILG